MKYTTTSILVLGFSVGTALADEAVGSHHRDGGPPPGARWKMGGDSVSDSDFSSTPIWQPGLSTGWFYKGAGRPLSNGRITRLIPTRTAFPSQLSLGLGSLLSAPASSAYDAGTTEVITVPNGGENINGNGANGGSIFVNHGQVVSGTPGATETIISQRDIGSGDGRSVQLKKLASKDMHHHHHINPANPTRTQTRTHVALSATPSASRSAHTMQF